MENKDKIRLLNINQIVINPDLFFPTTKNKVTQYVELILAHGNITPITVAPSGDDNGMFTLINGEIRIDAAAKAGKKEIPAVITDPLNVIDKTILSLRLSTIDDRGEAISQGIMISRIIENGYSNKQLAREINKSKAWISKRYSLAKDLSDNVKELVMKMALTPSTAQVIAKLPRDKQDEFASNVMKDDLSKNHVEKLVSLYRDGTTSETLRNDIITKPASVFLLLSKKTRVPKRQLTTIDSLTAQLNVTIRAINVSLEILSILNNDQLVLLKDYIINLLELANKLLAFGAIIDVKSDST